MLNLNSLTQQAIIQANPDTPFHYLSISTVGIVFLGTPHRGTEASKWGELIALSGSYLGFDTKDSILKDLKTDSENLADLLHQFALWLFRFSVPAVCFFEQHKTDYGKRFGVPWKEMVSQRIGDSTSSDGRIFRLLTRDPHALTGTERCLYQQITLRSINLRAPMTTATRLSLLSSWTWLIVPRRLFKRGCNVRKCKPKLSSS